ncbi:MAG: hypothetical protein WCL28_09855 [bacterium]
MDIKGITPSTLLLSVALSLPISLTSCNSSFSDPLAPRPVGEKFFVPADPQSQFPMNLHSETLVTRATLIKLSGTSDVANSRSGFATLSASSGVKFKSIALLGKHGFKDVYDVDRIKKLNDTQECRAIASDIREIIMSYPDLLLICGIDFTNDFRAATTVFVTTEDGKQHEFTSWGSHFSDGAGYRVVIQSLSL